MILCNFQFEKKKGGGGGQLASLRLETPLARDKDWYYADLSLYELLTPLISNNIEALPLLGFGGV